MVDRFPIIIVPEDACDRSEEEPIGSKSKFWFHHPELGVCLYKQPRSHTGEDWAEKIAAELCALMGLPHARYELATWRNQPGTVSPSFLPDGGSFIPGNQFLAPMVLQKVDLVLNAIGDNSVNLPLDWRPPVGIQRAAETFVGYLLLDAWICNTDRHAENWGIIEEKGEIMPTPMITKYLAPTYDHASSLGVRISDEERQNRLTTKDRGFFVSAYATRCRSLFYANNNGSKPTKLKTFEAFRAAALYYPQAAKTWLNCLARVSPDDTLALFQQIPPDRISDQAVEFAQKILEFNQHRLLYLRNKL